MKTHFITVDNAWPALKTRGMAGVLSPAALFPLHGAETDLHYTLLPDGALTCLFAASEGKAIGFGRILEGLPPSSGLQFYTHCRLDGEDRQFLALSTRVDYRCPFAPLQGFASVLSGRTIGRELERLEGATRAAYGTLLRCVQQEGATLALLGNPTPLLEILGPLKMTGAALECRETLTYNLSYLLLGPARLALLVEFNAFPEEGPFPQPAGDLEYLSATCVHLPDGEDLARMDEDVAEYLAFLRHFRKREGLTEAGFPYLERMKEEAGVALKGRVLVKRYLLLFAGSLMELRTKAQAYFGELCRAGVSFHASMIRAKDGYAHLYPGNYRVRTDAVRVEKERVPALLMGAHP